MGGLVGLALLQRSTFGAEQRPRGPKVYARRTVCEGFHSLVSAPSCDHTSMSESPLMRLSFELALRSDTFILPYLGTINAESSTSESQYVFQTKTVKQMAGGARKGLKYPNERLVRRL